MFENAIELNMQHTRAIHTIFLKYGSDVIGSGAASMFYVNSEGWAVTCKHVANTIIAAENMSPGWSAYSKEYQNIIGSRKKRELAAKFKFKKNQTIRIKNNFVGSVGGKYLGCKIIPHKELDLALIKIECENLQVKSFAKFPKKADDLKPGKLICRIGYPFAEFNNFELDTKTNDINWNQNGQETTPVFPIEGMITRKLAKEVENKRKIVGFEMSTPGLKGQSGGPAFDKDGIVWGLQSGTAHLHLGFDVEQTIQDGIKSKKVKDSAFLHVGHCVHASVIKEFMTEHNISFTEV
jgi:hypothetical protein